MKGSEPPARLPECLAILILRVLHFTQEDVISKLHYAKLTVGEVERWFKELPLQEAESLCGDPSLRDKANKIISEIDVEEEKIDVPTAMSVGKLSPEDILQHYRATEYLESKAQKQEGIDPSVAKARQRHFDNLAQIAGVLAHHVQRLLRYKDDKEVEVHGNIVEELCFFRKNAEMGCEGVEPLEEYEYEKQHPVDSYLADCLFAHYENQCGKLTFKSWKEVGEAGKENATQERFEDLVRLSHSEHIRFCPTCPICKAIASSYSILQSR